MSDKDIVTIERLTKNESVPVEVPGVGTVYVRELTVGDRISSRSEVMKLPEYDKLTDNEKLDEITMRLVTKTITDPKIEDLQSLKYNDWIAVVDVVSAFHSMRARKLADKRIDTVRDFLGLPKEEPQ